MSYTKSPHESQIEYETVPDRLCRLAETRKTHPAFVFIGEDSRQTLSYVDVYEKSKEFAKGLSALGIGKGDIVAIGNCNSPEWVFATFGTQMTGASPMHFIFSSSTGTQEIELLKSFENCAAVIIHTGNEYSQWKALENQIGSFMKNGEVKSDKIKSLRLVIAMNNPKGNFNFLTVYDIMNSTSKSTDLPTLDPESVASIFLTSGSTGIQKAVALSHHSLLTYAYFYDIVMRTYGKQGCIFYNDRPFSWSGGYPSWVLSNGGTLVTIDSLLLLPTAQSIADIAVRVVTSELCTCGIFIRSAIKLICEAKPRDFKLQTVVLAGGPLPSSVAKIALQICDEFVNFYGCSEIGGLAYKVSSGNHPVSEDYNVGVPLPGTEIKIVDKDGIMVPFGNTGEIYIRSPIPFVGYLNNSKEVRTQFGWYKTDDSGRFTEKGDLIVHGRVSDIIMQLGKLILPAPTEDAIRKHPSVCNCYVFPIKDEDLFFQKACAAIDVIPGAKLSSEDIKEFLTKQLNIKGQIDREKIPYYYTFFSGFPQTGNGKIHRRDIIEKSLKQLNM